MQKSKFSDLLDLYKMVGNGHSSVNLELILDKMIQTCLSFSTVDRAYVFLHENNEVLLRGQEKIHSGGFKALNDLPGYLNSVIDSVLHTGSPSEEKIGNTVVLTLPIVLNGKTVGVVSLEADSDSKSFFDETLHIFELLTAQLSLWVDNFAKIADQERSKQMAQFLDEATGTLSSSLDYEQTLKNIANLVVPFFADGCAIDLIEDGKIQRVGHAHKDAVKEKLLKEAIERFPAGLNPNSNPALVMRSKKPLLSSVVTDEVLKQGAVNQEHVGLLKALELRSGILVPLMIREEVLGIISVFSSKPGHFIEAHLELMQELARRCSIAIENAHLYREAKRAIKVRDDFLAIASHELRTPLTPLKMQLQLIKLNLQKLEDFTYKTELLKMLDQGEHQVDSLRALSENLLDVSLMRSEKLMLKKNRLNFQTLIKETVQQFCGPLERASCEVKIRNENECWGEWDQARLKQVFINLLTNAMKYGAGKPIEIGLEQINSKAVLQIKDYGIGISEENQKIIFNRFERGTSVRNYGGFGLGLYIAQQIAMAHGGLISVESRFGEGATFTVTLPLE